MNDAEKYWNERADKLRRFVGLCPLTPEEAEQALKRIRPQNASDGEIGAIVDAIGRGEVPEVEEQPSVDWSPECDYADIESDAVLFRNQGETEVETDDLENQLLAELLDDEEDDADDLES